MDSFVAGPAEGDEVLRLVATAERAVDDVMQGEAFFVAALPTLPTVSDVADVPCLFRDALLVAYVTIKLPSVVIPRRHRATASYGGDGALPAAHPRPRRCPGTPHIPAPRRKVLPCRSNRSQGTAECTASLPPAVLDAREHLVEV